MFAFYGTPLNVIPVRIMAPRIKIEDVLSTGEKISVVLEGPTVSKARVSQLLDMLQLMGGASEGQERPASLKEEVWRIIVENFGDGTWFSIRDLHNVARRELAIQVTSVSSYISRFVGEGRLEKRGSKPHTRYRLRPVYQRQR